MFEDGLSTRANGESDADFFSSFSDRHEHDCHDSETTDGKSDRCESDNERGENSEDVEDEFEEIILCEYGELIFLKSLAEGGIDLWNEDFWADSVIDLDKDSIDLHVLFIFADGAERDIDDVDETKSREWA